MLCAKGLRLLVFIAVFLVGSGFTSRTLANPLQDDPFRIQWHDHVFQSDEPLPHTSGSLSLAAYPDTVRGYYFVQLSDPVSAAMRDQLVSVGADLLDYVSNNAFIARMDTTARNQVNALSSVQHVSIFQPAMRISHDLTDRIINPVPDAPRLPPNVVDADPQPPPPQPPNVFQLTVRVFRDQNLADIQVLIEDEDGTILQIAQDPDRTKLLVSIPRGDALALPLINGVRWIEEYSVSVIFSHSIPVASMNDQARGVMNVAPVWDVGLLGADQIIGISDTGIDSGVNDASMHDDLQGRIDKIFSWPVQPGSDILTSGTDDGAADSYSGHGTHVAGSALGDGNRSAGAISGVAPQATLVFQALEQLTIYNNGTRNGMTGIPFDFTKVLQEAYDEGVRIHSNSWGKYLGGEYDSRSNDVDKFVWEHPDMLVLFSAQNGGVDLKRGQYY